jgi:hypothetical protein
MAVAIRDVVGEGRQEIRSGVLRFDESPGPSIFRLEAHQVAINLPKPMLRDWWLPRITACVPHRLLSDRFRSDQLDTFDPDIRIPILRCSSFAKAGDALRIGTVFSWREQRTVQGINEGSSKGAVSDRIAYSCFTQGL